MTQATESLHQQIMNLPVDPKQRDLMTDRELAAYKQGHREARHAAAELAVQQAGLPEVSIEAIADEVTERWSREGKMPPMAWDFRGFAADAIRAAIASGAVSAKALRMPNEADLMRAQMQSGADDLDRCQQAIRIFCEIHGLKLVDEEPLGDTYDDLWNALQRVDTAACMLPTFEVRHEGGIGPVTRNIVEAIAAATVKLQEAEEGQKRERVLVQALKGLADEFVKVYPIYYYAEPWAHNRNLALRFAQAVLADLAAKAGAVPEKSQIAAFLRGAGLAPQAAETAAGELIHYFAKGEWVPIENEAEKA